ncbi:rhomboid family intramembrane serine protease [soil metagenome]
MGEIERHTEFRKRKISFGDDKNTLMTIVVINAIIFVALSFIKVLFYIVQSGAGSYGPGISKWFILPADVSQLITRPWTLITYMFTHESLILVFTNMIWLWVFGNIFQNAGGSRRILPLYLYGGLAGALVYIAISYISPALRSSLNTSGLEGANAAIMAIAVAATTFTPDYRFFKMLNGGIPIWVLTLIYVAIDLAGLASGNMAFHGAHLAGAVTGFMFIVSLRKGNDWSVWMNDLWEKMMNVFNPAKNSRSKKLRKTIFYKADVQKPFVKKPLITQQRIDQILDKINQKGYTALSEEEKTILKKAGETDI